MGFDINTAKPVQGGFDISTAKPIEDAPAYGGKEGRSRFGLAGPVGFASAPGAEDVLPMVGQTVGTVIPGVNTLGGSVGGAMAGQAGRQAVKDIRKGNLGSMVSPLGVSAEHPGEIAGEGALTAATEGVFRGAEGLLRPAAGRLMNSVLKPGVKELSSGKNLGLEALDSGIWGSKKGMLSKARGMVSAGEDELQGLIKTTPGSVDVTDTLSGLDDLEKRATSIGDKAGVSAVQNLRDAIGTGRLNLENANQLKRNLYQAIGESKFGTSDVPILATARKGVARGLKEGIEGVIPEAKGINQGIGLGGRTRDALEKRMATEERSMILPKLAGISAGTAAMTGHIPTALGILGADVGIEGLRSAPVMTGTAAALNALSKNKALLSASRIGAREIQRRF